MNRIIGRFGLPIRRRFASPAKAVDVEPLLRPVRKLVSAPQLSVESFTATSQVYEIPLSAKDPVALKALPLSVLRSFSELNSNGLLLREQTKDIWQKILEQPAFVALLDGPKGIGKSSTLLQLVSTAISSTDPAFLVIYAPSVARWTAGYYPYYQSKTDSTKFDQPELAKEVLELFKFLNKEKMSPELSAFVEASDPIEGLSALTEQLSRSGTRVLVCMDQLNALYAPTQYRDQNGRTLVAEDMSVLSLMKRLAEDSSMTVIAANDRSDPLIRNPDWNSPASRLLQSTINLKPFSRTEVSNLLSYYRELGHSYKESPKYTEIVQFVSGGIPAKITDACNYESIYTA